MVEQTDGCVVDVLIGIGYLNSETDRIAEMLRTVAPPNARPWLTVTQFPAHHAPTRWHVTVHDCGHYNNEQWCTKAAEPIEALHALERLILRRQRSDAAIARTLGIEVAA